MLHWLKRFGLRLWRSCCYPFQAIAALLGGKGEGRSLASRRLPQGGGEAIHDGLYILPEDPETVDWLPAEEFSGAALSALSERSDAESADLAASKSDLAASDINKRPPLGDPSVVLDSPLSLGQPKDTHPKDDHPKELHPKNLGKRDPRRMKFGLTDQQELDLPAPPFDWILAHRLAIGPLPKKAWLQSFEEQGIRTIISLCSEVEGKLPKAMAAQFRCVRVPLPDSHYRRSLIPAELEEAVDLIHWNLQKRQPVYLHCLAGIERSPLVAIAYLCRYCSMDLLDATGWLAHVHGSSQPTPSQLKVVRQYLQQYSQ
jgi:atypical dual specificity phosphatase